MISVRHSHVIRTIILLITMLSLSSPAYAKYSGGTGEPNNPYQIATAEDLMLLGGNPEDYDKHFILMADIDLAAYENSDFNSIGNLTSPFTGVFDGNNNVISNFYYTSSKINYLGLFGRIHGSDTVIKNFAGCILRISIRPYPPIHGIPFGIKCAPKAPSISRPSIAARTERHFRSMLPVTNSSTKDPGMQSPSPVTLPKRKRPKNKSN